MKFDQSSTKTNVTEMYEQFLKIDEHLIDVQASEWIVMIHVARSKYSAQKDE